MRALHKASRLALQSRSTSATTSAIKVPYRGLCHCNVSVPKPPGWQPKQPEAAVRPASRPYATVNEEHVSRTALLKVPSDDADRSKAKSLLRAPEGQARQLRGPPCTPAGVASRCHDQRAMDRHLRIRRALLVFHHHHCCPLSVPSANEVEGTTAKSGTSRSSSRWCSAMNPPASSRRSATR